jgi:hypothetical protein
MISDLFTSSIGGLPKNEDGALIWMELSLLSKNMGEARELANRVRNKTAAEITPPDRRDEKATKEMEH